MWLTGCYRTKHFILNSQLRVISDLCSCLCRAVIKLWITFQALFFTPISKPVSFGWILTTTGNFTHSILWESSILSHIRCCRLQPLMTALVWSFACTCNNMLLSSINVQHFMDTIFCRVLCSCCVSLKVVSDQMSGPVFSHYFSWLHNKNFT